MCSTRPNLYRKCLTIMIQIHLSDVYAYRDKCFKYNVCIIEINLPG